MDHRPLVSCVIIFLNAQRYLGEAIESVFAQTYEDWELLVVDDGSTDESTAIAQRYADCYPDRVRYLEHPGHQNRGMSASRNLGIANARGAFIALLDADDVWLPQKLATQVSILEAQPEAGMVYDTTLLWFSWTGDPEARQNERLRRLGVPADTLIRPPDLIPLLLRGDAEPLSICSVLIRREVVDQVGGFVEAFRGMFEDQVFFYKVCLDFPVFISDGYSALYRQHPDSCCLVAEKKGLYPPSHTVFLDWLTDYMAEKIAAGNPNARLLPDEVKNSILRRKAYERMTAGDYQAGMASINAACRYDRTLRFSQTYRGYAKWALKLYLRDLLGRVRRPAPTS